MWRYPSKLPATSLSLPIHFSLIFPFPLHLSAQIVLLINYAIVPIGRLIAASSSTFPLQINSLTTVAATGWAKISDAACVTGASVSSSFWQMKLQRRASDLHQAASLHRIATDLPTPQHLSFYRKDHFIDKSRCWLAGRLKISLHFNCNNVNQCERGVGHRVLNMQGKQTMKVCTRVQGVQKWDLHQNQWLIHSRQTKWS